MQIVLFVVALSMDLFLASWACGAEHIKIDRKTALCISLISSGVLFFSLFIGEIVKKNISEEVFKWIYCFGFFLLGIYKIKEDPTCVDKDSSKRMSVTEGALFAIIMSMDGMIAGIGAAYLEMRIVPIIGVHGILGYLGVRAGTFLGEKMADENKKILSGITGILFIILAIAKLF